MVRSDNFATAASRSYHNQGFHYTSISDKERGGGGGRRRGGREWEWETSGGNKCLRVCVSMFERGCGYLILIFQDLVAFDIQIGITENVFSCEVN